MPMRLSRMFGLILCLLMCAGCLTSERREFRVQLSDDRVEFRLTESGWKSKETDASKIRDDFNGLIDQYAHIVEPDTSIGGVTIHSRRLYLKDSKIHTELHGSLSPSDTNFRKEFRISDREIRYEFDVTDGDSVECNGRIIQTDTRVSLIWPADAKLLIWATTNDTAVRLPNNLVDLYLEWEKK